jgi:tripartite-type tricarboxylate transporter receptor subunit TctC
MLDVRTARTTRTTWGRGLAAAICAATLAMTASACGTSGSSSGSSTAAVDKDFYKGKTITWVVPDPPGSGFYTVPTILAPLIGKYLDAKVNILSVPAGVTIAGQNQAAAAKNDGLTIGTLHVAGNIVNAATKQPGINFDMTGESLIAGLPINQVVFVTSPNSPYKTWDDLVTAAPKTTAATTTGNIQLLQQAAYGAYGVSAHMISGYSSPADQIAGFLRGDAQLAANSTSSLISSIKAGKATPLLLTSPYSATMDAGAPELKDVPDLATYEAAHPPAAGDGSTWIKAALSLYGSTSANQGFFAPSGTPANRVAALTEAFQAAIQDPSAQQAFLAQNIAGTYMSPAEVSKAIAAGTQAEQDLASVASGYQG